MLRLILYAYHLNAIVSFCTVVLLLLSFLLPIWKVVTDTPIELATHYDSYIYVLIASESGDGIRSPIYGKVAAENNRQLILLAVMIYAGVLIVVLFVCSAFGFGRVFR